MPIVFIQNYDICTMESSQQLENGMQQYDEHCKDNAE